MTPHNSSDDQSTVRHRYVPVSDGWYCNRCGGGTTNRYLHTLLQHTWPFRRWTA